jgi:hypothetical protein
MPKKLLATLVPAALVLTGCGSSVSSTEADTDTVDEVQDTQQASAPAATTSTADAQSASTIHAFGDTVDTPGGSSVTAYDYRVITTPGGEREGVLEVKVCIGDPVEGYDGGSVLTEFWSIEDGEDRRYQPASSYGENDEVSPILPFESMVAWNDCVRGWIVMDTDDNTDAQTVRYFNSMTEEPGAEEIRWAIP